MCKNNKTNPNNAILHKLLIDMLGDDFANIGFDIGVTFSFISFGYKDQSKYIKCMAVIDTLIAFGLIRVRRHDVIHGIQFFYFEFVKND